MGETGSSTVEAVGITLVLSLVTVLVLQGLVSASAISTIERAASEAAWAYARGCAPDKVEQAAQAALSKFARLESIQTSEDGDLRRAKVNASLLIRLGDIAVADVPVARGHVAAAVEEATCPL
ncbi:MAG: hypothetical protein LBR21_03580 [Propionibacteriaceae bacterium]|jgi:hypothetical protein|nr:hypothetical protein [Propionibacteriaceae bacterium]